MKLSLSLTHTCTHAHAHSVCLIVCCRSVRVMSVQLRLASFVSDASDTAHATAGDSGGTGRVDGSRNDTDAVCALVTAFATQQRATPDMNRLERYLRETSPAKCFTIVAETITENDASEEVQTSVIAYAMCCLGYACVYYYHVEGVDTAVMCSGSEEDW